MTSVNTEIAFVNHQIALHAPIQQNNIQHPHTCKYPHVHSPEIKNSSEEKFVFKVQNMLKFMLISVDMICN